MKGPHVSQAPGPPGGLCLHQRCSGPLEKRAEQGWARHKHYTALPTSTLPPIPVSIHLLSAGLTASLSEQGICILKRKSNTETLMLLEGTVPTQSQGVDARIYCHPCANSRTDPWKSPASELFPMFCRVRRSYPHRLRVHVKANSILGNSNPGGLPERVTLNLVLKDNVSLIRRYSVILPTCAVVGVKTRNLEMSKLSWNRS